MSFGDTIFEKYDAGIRLQMFLHFLSTLCFMQYQIQTVLLYTFEAIPQIKEQWEFSKEATILRGRCGDIWKYRVVKSSTAG